MASIANEPLRGLTDSPRRWRGSGKEIPIVASHKWGDPFAIIGSAHPENVRETSRGLLVRGRLDTEDNPTAKQVYKLTKRGNLSAWSFGFTVPEDGAGRGKDGTNEI